MFKSIGKAISDAYNSVKSGISKALSSVSGKSNVAAVGSLGTSNNTPVTRTINAVQVPNSVGPVGSASYNSFVASNPVGTTISSGSNSSGGVGAASYGPQLPVTISAGRQSTGSSSSPTLNLSGYNPAAFAPTTISARTLGAQTGTPGGASLQSTGGSIGNPVSLSSAPTSVNPGTINNTGLAGTVAGYKQYNAKTGQFDDIAQTPETTLDAKLQKELDLYKKYMPEKQSVYEDPQVIAARNERQRLQQALQVPTAELNAIVAKQNQDLLQLRQTGSQEGVTEAVYGGQQNAINYNAAIRALPLQASISAVQGDLKLAQDYLTELTQIKQDQINKQYEYNKGQFEAIKGVLTREDERAYKEITTANDRVYKEQQDLIKYQAELTTNALAQKAPQSVINRINNANSIQNAIMAAGEYGGNVKDKIAVENANLQNQRLTQEIEANKPITGEYAPIINNIKSLNLSADSRKNAIQSVSESLASGNYTNAYANIANAVENSLNGEVATKFANARNDMGIMSGMRDAIKAYTDAGGDVGFLKGSADKIAKKFGQLATDPKFASLGVQLERQFQEYRLNMTGAAFSPGESREYASVNPRTNASLDLNIATIDGALSQLTNKVTSTINQRIPEAQKIYDKAYGSADKQQTVNISGKDYVVGQVYEDASKTKWVVDSNGKWTTQ